jgi:A/G-specific adenine glycosylase
LIAVLIKRRETAILRCLENPKDKLLVPRLLNWFSANARDLPWRRTRDPYAIWVSEIMLQQTQVKTVMPYWERWMKELPTIQAAANASPDKIHKLWEGLGYYTRVRNLQKAAKQIVAQHDARSETRRRRGNESQTENKLETPHVVSYEFPDNFDDVLALPGIGRYTAGAICSIAFNQPTPILDGNVIRVLTRVFGIAKNPREKKTNAQLWRLAEELVVHASANNSRTRTSRLRYTSPHQGTKDEDEERSACSHFVLRPSYFNQSLMELGALICTPRQPQCPVCPVKKLCVAFQENRVAELPNLGRRTAATARRFVAFVVERGGKFLVRQRPAGVVNAHLWEFPNVEIAPNQRSSPAKRDESAHYSCKNSQSRLTSAATVQEPDLEIIRAAKSLGIEPPTLQPLCTVKHSITRYRITLEAWRVFFGGSNSVRPKNFKMGRRGTLPSETGVWLTPAQLQPLAFASAHKKLASAATDCILSGR